MKPRVVAFHYMLKSAPVVRYYRGSDAFIVFLPPGSTQNPATLHAIMKCFFGAWVRVRVP